MRYENGYRRWNGALFLMAVVAACTAWPESATLKLREEVYVKGPEVLLGDLAEIHGEGAAALADFKVMSAARPGASKEVTASYVLSRLRYAGFSEMPIVTGAARVRITTESVTLEPGIVAEDLRQFIHEKMPWDPVDAIVTVEPPRTALVMPDGEFDIVWRSSARYRYLGTGVFSGTVLIDGKPQKTVFVKANINVMGTVVVAKRDIPRGRPISPADVELREQPLSENSSSAITTIEEALGKVTRRTHFPGQVLTHKNIQARVLIKRNQLVNVEIRSGAILVQTRAKALNDARAGDFVLCANLVTKKKFQGIARADGTVVVQ